MADSFKHLNEDNFQNEIKGGTILVDFYADWCGPCRMLNPLLEKIAGDLKGKASIGKLDIENAQRTASFYQVTSIPTLILFKNGKEVGRLIGLRDEQTIKDFILKN